MTITAAILLSISAVVHASWNLLGKREQPSSAFMLAANTLGFLLLLPALIFYGRVLTFFSPLVWAFVALTGLCQAVYFVALAGAYRSGDLSVAYPLVRASPVVFVVLITTIFGLGKPLGPQPVVGILLVIAGSFVLPMQHFSDFRPGNYFNLTSLLALTAALGTAGYSIIDSEALRHLHQAPGLRVNGYAITAIYALMEGVSTSLWLALFVLISKEERQNLGGIGRKNIPRSALVGIGIYAGYLLVLISMAYVTNVSYVVAFRQLSIPLGALLGVLILKEPHPLPKFVGVAIIFIGLVLLGTGPV